MIKSQTEINEFAFPHLGHGIRSLLESRNMSQRELATRTALSSSYISSVVQGSRPISPSFARKLEQVFSVKAEDIMFKQVKRDLDILNFEEGLATMNKDLTILPKIMPIVPLLLHSDQPITVKDEPQILKELLYLFGVSSLENLPALYQVRAYPEPPAKRANLYLLTAWALHCEELSKSADSEVPFDRDKIFADRYDLLQPFKQCKDLREVSQLLNPYGITLFLYHPFEGSIVNGFARATAKGNLVLIISSREKEADNPMPALRHLLGHIINGDVSGSFIDFKTAKTPADKRADGWYYIKYQRN